ncbi:MAG: D-alanyl-D-alanine carboxypeptidase [Candidatus Tectomicrobia bacterium]|nr:D-alanyl-D-alanine carboxypeptidase [Candidatus Tectomicrobia bacterium]
MMLPPEEVSINTRSAVLIDALTGDVLLAHHPHLRIAPASFVKLLSLYVIFDAIKHGKLGLQDDVYVSKKAWKTSGSKMFIEVNEKVPVEELLKGIAVVSGNDATVAMAEHLYGDTATFVQVMNKYAQHLGMTHSSFTNPHGLPNAKQLTTAYDMALLARQYVNQFPQALRYHSMQEYTYAGITQQNRNGLLKRHDAVDGLKTGWVVKSGYNLAATANRDQHRLIAVVMGARTNAIRERETLKLLNYGYQNFALLPFVEQGEVLTELPVWKGVQDLLPVLASNRSVMVVPREYTDRVRTTPVLPQDIVAPIEKNQVLGKLLVTIGTQNVRSIPLIAGVSVGKAGFFKTLGHDIYRRGFDSAHTWFVVTGSMLSLGVMAAVVVIVGKKKRRRRPLHSRLRRSRMMRNRLVR